MAKDILLFTENKSLLAEDHINENTLEIKVDEVGIASDTGIVYESGIAYESGIVH